MDIVTLAMAKPKIVDMREFTIGSDYSFNESILEAIQVSMQKGGVWINARLPDYDTSLSKALTYPNTIMYISVPSENAECFIPLATVQHNGECAIASASTPCFMSGVSFTLDIMFVWEIDVGVDEMLIMYVKATPFTATSA